MNTTQRTREYYNSSDADEFYYRIWGGEDIHIGIYADINEPIRDASRRTVATMASMVNITSLSRVLDLGSGYGGAARYIADKIGCNVVCLNLSATENKRNIEKNKEANLDKKIEVVEGSFEQLEFGDATFDIVWSEDAILHAGDKKRVFAEIARVLKPGGFLIFTDPMQADNCPEGVLEPVLQRIHLQSMGSIKLYRELAKENKFREIEIRPYHDQLTLHYTRVRDELLRKKEELLRYVSLEYIERMLAGLTHWVESAAKNYLAWGILHFEKM
ncbi:MAG TPA: methyltransferase domain-containing protein [Turneriella sp.]|nr:methyltransferase domain-containing protein [Turneriella sp.]